MTAIERDDLAAAGDEPWMPTGLTFEVGQRVRIHLSAECQFPRLTKGGHSVGVGPDGIQDDGLTGVIMHRALWSVAREHGHPYVVKWDGFKNGGGWYAAAELIPLAPAQADAEGSRQQ